MMWEATAASPVMMREGGRDYWWKRQNERWNKWTGTPPAFIAYNEQTGEKLGALTLRPYFDLRMHNDLWEMGLGVAPSARRQGVGELLTRHAAEYVRKAGLPYLVLTVDPANRAAFMLYRKLNFRLTNKRHGVFEMRYNFTPSLPDDPAIVANRRYFIQYWTTKEYQQGDRELHHSAPYRVESPFFRQTGLKPDDFVYVVSVIKGRLYLVVKYEVEKLLTFEEAKIEFPHADDLDPALDYAITGRTTMYSFDPPLEDEFVQQLRLIENGELRPWPRDAAGFLNGRSLHGLREIPLESAQILDDFVEIFR